MTLLPENLPAIEQLKGNNKWVAWKYVERDGKKTKPPVNPHNGRLAKNNDPKDWGSYEQAAARAKKDKLPGVGYVLTGDDFLVGADLDHVRNAGSGELEKWAQEIVDLSETYIEVSPSGTGLRIFWDGKIEKAITNKKKGVEIYSSGRYLTITGNHIEGTPKEIMPAPKTEKMLRERAGMVESFSDGEIPAHIKDLELAEGRGLVDDSPSGKWQVLNNAALANLDAWVPALFGKGAVRTQDGRYRVSSKSLGRKLQEDLSISPEGIKDFGIADMGDAKQGKRTPLDLVVEYSQACKKVDDDVKKLEKAFTVLSERLGRKVAEVKSVLEIYVKDGEIARIVDETQRAMIATDRPIYIRGGSLVEPIWSRYPTHNGQETVVTTFRPVGIETLRYMVNKHGISFHQWNRKEKKFIVIDPPDKVLATLVKLGHWEFPRVAGIINAPTMRPDGTILEKRGYDKVTQLWCWPHDKLKMPEIKDVPSRKDAMVAIELLRDLISGSCFVSELDRSVALASIMTAVMRGAFDVAPMTLFVAHMAGTGKSYLVDIISMIVRGRPCPVATASRNEEEMEKRIGSFLIESAPMISIDNLSFDLKSDLLCQMCTQQTVKVRILGKSETPECEWKGSMFATGNNISLSGDMTRRGLICNLDAGTEKPELREFDFSPMDLITADQGKYIAAVLTIARAFIVSGVKLDCRPIGSYGYWSKFVREPLLWLGEEDPIKSMEQAYEEDPNKDAAERLIEQWKEHLGTKQSYKLSEIVEKAKETVPGVVMGPGIPDWVRVRQEMFDLLVEKAGDRGQIDLKKFGNWLRSLKGQIYSGFKIVVSSESGGHGHRWILREK